MPLLRVGAARLFSSTRALNVNMSQPTTNVFGAEIKFGPFPVTNQPLIPGHILISPLTPHRRLTDLSPSETADLFQTVQLTQRLLANIYFPSADINAGSFSVAVQDGPEAGQTVPHVHVHVIPRVKGDLERPDDIYVKMAGEEGNVGGALWDVKRRPEAGGGLPRIEDEDRSARTKEEMNEEAEKYRAKLKEMGIE